MARWFYRIKWPNEARWTAWTDHGLTDDQMQRVLHGWLFSDGYRFHEPTPTGFRISKPTLGGGLIVIEVVWPDV